MDSKTAKKELIIIVILFIVGFIFNFYAPEKFKLDFSELIGKILAVVDAVFALLVILGIVVDPTTAGVGDSKRAMGYQEPYKDPEG